MPMIPATLSAAFTQARVSYPDNSDIVATVYAQAIVAFWTSAIGPLGGAVIAIPGQSSLEAELKNAMSSFFASTQVIAGFYSIAIDNALKAILIVGGADGILTGPISGQNVVGLHDNLTSLWESAIPNIPTVCEQEANLIHDFTLSGTATTTGIPVPMIPGIGPIT